MIALVVVGCAETAPRPDFPTPEDGESVQPPRLSQQRQVGVTRAEFRKLIEAGPGALLAQVRVKPYATGGHFTGWEIVALAPPLDRGPLRPGDVVARINGRVIERPDQLADLWTTLGATSELVFDVLRGGVERELRVRIVESW